MSALDLVKVRSLMEISEGRPDISVALIDGPVALNLPDFVGARIREIPGRFAGYCNNADSVACSHGTLVAGILVARRAFVAPAMCPGCTLLLRPIYPTTTVADSAAPSATPNELAEAIVDCVHAGAHVINLSAALLGQSAKEERALTEALN